MLQPIGSCVGEEGDQSSAGNRRVFATGLLGGEFPFWKIAALRAGAPSPSLYCRALRRPLRSIQARSVCETCSSYDGDSSSKWPQPR